MVNGCLVTNTDNRGTARHDDKPSGYSTPRVKQRVIIDDEIQTKKMTAEYVKCKEDPKERKKHA